MYRAGYLTDVDFIGFCGRAHWHIRIQRRCVKKRVTLCHENIYEWWLIDTVFSPFFMFLIIEWEKCIKYKLKFKEEVNKSVKLLKSFIVFRFFYYYCHITRTRERTRAINNRIELKLVWKINHWVAKYLKSNTI